MKIFRNMEMKCGEGPLWEARKNRLIWVDSDDKKIFAGSVDSSDTVLLSDDIDVSSVTLAKDGYIILGQGVWKMDFDGNKKLLFDSYQGEELFFNDSTVGPDGAIYAGTYYWGAEGMEKTGKLYRIANNNSVTVLDEDIFLSNGLGFTADGSTLYYADSAKRMVYSYSFDKQSGEVSDKRDFVKTTVGIPDGLTVDSSGNVWVAMWYEGAVYCYDSLGNIKNIIRTPALQTSSVGFGGKDMSELFITSANDLFESELIPNDFDYNSYFGGNLYCENLSVFGIFDRVADI